jgi:CelD/BcsL family acetyltransferase involved in cellulose biosynthesis
MGKLQLAGRMREALRTLVPAGLHISQPHRTEFPAIQRGGLIARCHADWPNDPEFIPQWNSLLKRNPWATAFRSPAWQSAVVDEFVPGGEFRLLTVHRDGGAEGSGEELLAIVPLALNTASMLETPGRWVTDYLDPLIDADAAIACWEIVLQILEELWDWSVGGVVFHHIRADSTLRQILPAIVHRFGFNYHESDVQKAPYIELPKTWEEYLATLNGHERKEFKRKLRNAQTKYRARWLKHTSAHDCLPALERALAAMRQAKSEKADFTEEILIGFLRRLCPKMIEAGDFYVHELFLEDKPSAWMLALPSPWGPMIYNTAYDHAQRHLSPGAVAFAMGIKEAIEAGHPRFNFLRGGEEYKENLGGVDLELIKVTLRRR